MKIIIFCCLLFGSLGAQVNDVDSFLGQILSKSSIVSTRQIVVPDYPNVYNPSLIEYKDGYLLSFRYKTRCPETVKNNCRTDVSFVGIARLDKNFKVLGKSVQLLNIESFSSKLSLFAEDARLLKVDGRIFIFFNDLPVLQGPGTFAMYFGELVEVQGRFSLREPAKLLNYSQAISIEKNWTPFVSGGKLYLIYSDQPRVILEVDLNTGYCNEVSRTDVDWKWDLGKIRGGTPAYLVNDQFLTFFHSSFPANIQKGRAYVIGAYVFDKDPPFTVRKMTVPLGDIKDYTQNNSSKVIFPAGMVVQENVILVAWGKGDRQIFISTFDREKLFNEMKPLSE
jgi:predicted GH43/DUF377 family glycosyl hydrolase